MADLRRGGVKICGVTCAPDALAAVRAGAQAIGLNFVPGSVRCIDEDTAARIRHVIPSTVLVAGVFADSSADAVFPLAARLALDAVQLHGNESPESWRGATPIWRAIRVRGPETLNQLPAWADVAQTILLDGAGRGGAIFDWSLLAEARRLTSLPIILAGGLTPDNVAEAVRAAKPFAVDVASGVESSPGKKDESLMRAFVDHARAAMDAPPEGSR